MKTRSSGSSDDGSGPFPESEISKLDDVGTIIDRETTPNLRSSSTRSRTPNGVNWEHTGSYANGVDSAAAGKPTPGPPPPVSLSASPLTEPNPKTTCLPNLRHNGRSLWSMSILALLTAFLGLAVLATISYMLLNRQLDPKGCRMSYMRPSYLRFSDFDTEHTRFATKYSLYLYREQGVDDPNRVWVPFPASQLAPSFPPACQS